VTEPGPPIHQDVEGDVQPDGSMLFRMDVPPTATTVVIGGVEFSIPRGTTRMHVIVSVDDSGETTLRMRPIFDGGATT